MGVVVLDSVHSSNLNFEVIANDPVARTTFQNVTFDVVTTPTRPLSFAGN